MLKEKSLIPVVLFSIAMAYLESAVVVYLRVVYGIENVLQDINLTPDRYTIIEIGREAATIVMLAMIAMLVGQNKPKKLGYFLLTFGIWDIFYYIWLYIFIDWPQSIFEWDILFLIPLPWWGPVIAPVLISVLLISIGILLINDFKFKVKMMDWMLFVISVILILYSFTEDSIRIIFSGEGNFYEIRPTSYSWILFIFPFLLWVIISIKVFFPLQKNINGS